MELFVGSLLFYAFGDLNFLPLLLILCVVNHMFAMVSKSQEGTEGRQWILAAIVILDVGVLVVFKILMLALGWALPLGISFYLFKMISFQADVYTGKIKNPPAFLETAAYFTLFFQMAQGPIMRYSKQEFLGKRHQISFLRIERGFKTVIIGLAMKALLADRLAILWNEAQKIGFESLSTPLAWLVAFGYSLQLYLDFWGYSLIAAGIGIMLGFSFVDNFLHPYAASSVGEFFRRWHVTLTSWFKDYVYIPLGGNRKDTKRTLINIMCVWLLTGFWHGGGLHFILWGLVLGLLICAEKLFLGEHLQKHPVLAHIYVILVIPVTWMLFAANTTMDAFKLLGRMFPLTGHFAGASASDFARYFGQFFPYILVGAILCLPPVYDLAARVRAGRVKLIESILLMILLWTSLYSIHVSQANPFMYFSF